MKKAPTLILCENLLSMSDPAGTITQNQMITITEDGRIHSVKPTPATLPPADKVISLPHHLVCPGLINTHTHLPMTLFRGLGEGLSLQSWLNDIIFPLEKAFVEPEFVRVGTELALWELIKNGTTTVCDMYFHTSTVARVIDSYGLRGLLAVDMMNLYSPWEEELHILRSNYKNSTKILPWLACHSPYTCDSKLLKLCAKESEKQNLPVTIHVAETLKETQILKDRQGLSPVAYLNSLGLTGPQCLFAHCVHLTEEDINLLKETKTSVSHNPESNMKLGSGTAPLVSLLKKGIPVGLGTDGAASNNNLNLFTEMDTAFKLQKLHHPGCSLKPYDIFALVTTQAARAVGMGHQIGKIEKNFLADIIALDLHHPHLYPRHDLLSHLVHSATGGEVDFVMCEGQILMQNGEVAGKNPSRVYREAQAFQQKIRTHLLHQKKASK